MNIKKIILLFLFAFLCLPVWAQREAVYNFISTLNIRPDASVTVTERITINAQHQNIRRGIYRELPANNNEKITVKSLTMDGQEHPYFVEEPSSNALRINFGDDNFLTRGPHTYELTYDIANAVRFFKDYDEIYWNVTGNGWNFPIHQASVKVNLPDGAQPFEDKISLYTGYYGSKSNNTIQTGHLSYQTTRTLNNREGMTIAVPWQKGFVREPLLYKLRYILMIIPAVFTALLFAYYFITWYKYGRDSKDIAPVLYAPPADTSPAFIRYFKNKRMDSKCLSVNILSLALKNKLKITQNYREANLELLDRAQNNLTEDEAALLGKIFAGRSSFVIDAAHAHPVSILQNMLRDKFSKKEKLYRNSNKKFLLTPVLVLIAWQLLFIPAAPLIFINLHYSVFLVVSAIAVPSRILKVLVMLVLTLFYSAFFIPLLINAQPFIIAAEAGFLLGLWGLIFYSDFIDKLTPKGKIFSAEVEGFRRYMTIAEAHRAELSDPDAAGRIFCDYLPYAFAFNIQNKWIKKFSKIIGATAMEQLTTNAGGFKAVRGGLLAGAVASAMPNKSGGGSGFSSGSGGGGFSGGGSGGGGGGGR